MSRSASKWFVLLFVTVAFWGIPVVAQRRPAQAQHGNAAALKQQIRPN
jgi:hypothetical protein